MSDIFIDLRRYFKNLAVEKNWDNNRTRITNNSAKEKDPTVSMKLQNKHNGNKVHEIITLIIFIVIVAFKIILMSMNITYIIII